MGYKFRDTNFSEIISAATAQKREHKQQQQQRVSAVWSPNGVFTISNSAVLMFCPFSANIQFNFCIALISKQSMQQQHTKKDIVKSNNNSIG